MEKKARQTKSHASIKTSITSGQKPLKARRIRKTELKNLRGAKYLQIQLCLKFYTQSKIAKTKYYALLDN